MEQPSLFKLSRVVNVAEVPQRSPFRYPGGKTWLVPHIRRWLHSLPERPAAFIEPFAGGGAVSLTVAFEDLARHIIMVELDDHIAAVWRTIFSRNREWLADRIASFSLSSATAADIIESAPRSIRERAFQTIVKNRIFHGGILAEGSGMLKKGENGRGIHSRWYPETLYKRIMDIGTVSDKISFFEGDGFSVIRRYATESAAAFFVDPPYTAGGKGKRPGTRLYRHCELDHELLFREMGRVRGEFLMTYDDAAEVRELARAHGFAIKRVPMKGTRHVINYELLISRSLDWLER